jgi:high-affinity K+ transport system ATPase subunit B
MFKVFVLASAVLFASVAEAYWQVSSSAQSDRLQPAFEDAMSGCITPGVLQPGAFGTP